MTVLNNPALNGSLVLLRLIANQITAHVCKNMELSNWFKHPTTIIFSNQLASSWSRMASSARSSKIRAVSTKLVLLDWRRWSKSWPKMKMLLATSLISLHPAFNMLAILTGSSHMLKISTTRSGQLRLTNLLLMTITRTKERHLRKS